MQQYDGLARANYEKQAALQQQAHGMSNSIGVNQIHAPQAIEQVERVFIECREIYEVVHALSARLVGERNTANPVNTQQPTEVGGLLGTLEIESRKATALLVDAKIVLQDLFRYIP